MTTILARLQAASAGVDTTSVESYPPAFAETLAAAQAGDGLAFGRLYDSLQQRVAAFARVRGHADPEGLVNDTFLQVFRNLHRFDGNEPQFGAWVFTIARNRLIDESRKRARRPIESGDDHIDPNRPAPVDVESDALARIAGDSMLILLDHLTDDQRDVVLLRVVSDLTIDAIAEILGKRPAAVKALQRRAFRALAAQIERPAEETAEKAVPL